GVADAEERLVEEADGEGENLVAAQLSPPEVALDAAAERGQGLPEGDHPVELDPAAHLAPALVVAVLLAALLVAAGGLEVAVRERADPDLVPRRRDRERLDPLALGVGDEGAVGVVVGKARAAAAARDAGLAVGDVDQPGDLGGALRVGREEGGGGAAGHRWGAVGAR